MTKKVVIAGAGIGGLCTAIALAKRGLEVDIFEQSPQLGEVGAGIQLSPNAMRVLSEFGLSSQLASVAFRPKAAVMRHYKTGKYYFSVPLGEHANKRYSADYLHIHRADLHRALHQSCQDIGVNIHLGQPILSYSHLGQRVSVHLANGERLSADVLIGADGVKSAVRGTMGEHLGFKTAPEFTGQVAWRGVIETNKLPQYLVKPNANLWVGPGKHFVSYYLRGGDLVNFVAVEERADWLTESWSEPGDIGQLRAVFEGWHPEVSEILAATESCFLWALYSRKPLTKWTDKNVALVGDACHPMLPFLAQGAAMAIEDSYALAHCLTNVSDVQLALNHYEDLRLKRATEIQLNAGKNTGLYHMNSKANRAKLSVLFGLSAIGLSRFLATKKVDPIYSYNIVEELL